MFRQRVRVDFEYPVLFTRDLFNPHHPALPATLRRPGETGRHRLLAFVDAGVAAGHPGLCARMERFFERHRAQFELCAPPFVVPGGERIKSDFALLRDVFHRLARPGFCRHSFVVVVGGGAVLDAVGFATALVHRGLRLVRVPSTVVAQNDAGVGVKNGINTEGAKNALGTFAPPFAVLNDFDLLATLSDRDWIAGTAEAFKVALIKDERFFRFLVDHAEDLRRRDATSMERLVQRCAELHLDHIRTGGDPFEQGAARPLDLGHWSAHRLESLSGYRVRHGEAVAAGLAVDARYAVEQGWLGAMERDTLERGLRTAGLPLWQPEMGLRDARGELELLRGIEAFREHLGGELCVTFPRGLGAKIEVHEIDRALMTRCILSLQPG